MEKPIKVADFVVHQLPGPEPREGRPIGADEPTTGLADLFDVRGPDGLHLCVEHIRWKSRQIELCVGDRHESPQRFDGLVGRLRVSVKMCKDRETESWCELRQARLKGTRPEWCNATEEELDEGAGVSLRNLLIRGLPEGQRATAVMTRAELLGDTSNRSRIFAVVFPTVSILVPVVAYVMTHAAPVVKELRAT